MTLLEHMRDIPACGKCQAERSAGGTDPENVLRSTFAVGNAEVCDVCALSCCLMVAMPQIEDLSGRLRKAVKLLDEVLWDDLRKAGIEKKIRDFLCTEAGSENYEDEG